MSTALQLPKTIPLMPLPGVVLMPHALLPLFIFEHRYREMLSDCLETHRIYAVPMMKPGVQEVTCLEEMCDVAGVGLIRACVNNPDGTSNLILQGLRRVKIRRLFEDFSYRTGEVEELRIHTESPALESASLENLRQLCEAVRDAGHPLPPVLDEQLQNDQAHPSDLADLAGSAFVKDPIRLQELLEELIVEKRIEKLLDFLR